MRPDGRVGRIAVRSYTVPTSTFGVEQRESDGTAEWDSTGVLVIEVESDGVWGLGYSYTSAAAVLVVRDALAPIVLGSNPLDTESTFWSMARAVRNLGWSGICASAISAVDVALHDLRSRMLEVSLVQLLGGARSTVMAYGSGGFTSYAVP